jgi:tRNA pseudouridine55 synthase
LPHLDGVPKEYEATIVLGTETETDDLHGAVVRTAPLPSDEAITDAIGRLTGTLDQVPPAYSAKRVDGRRAYEAARSGVALDLAPSRVEVYAWRDVVREGEVLRATIACGGGTYVRALARDLGRLSGSAAHLAMLRRTRSGPFRVDDAVTVDAIREGRVFPKPALDALPTIPHVELAPDDAERVLRGIAVPRTEDAPRAALVDSRTGALLALAEGAGSSWQPRVVMRKVG